MAKNIGALVLTLSVTSRVRTSEGAAAFLFPRLVTTDTEVEGAAAIPAKGKHPAKPAVTEIRHEESLSLEPVVNDLGGKWIRIPKGSVVTVCAAYEKTDTWMCAVQIPESALADFNKASNTDFKAGQILGMVLRRMSFDALKDACEVTTAADIKVSSAAPAASTELVTVGNESKEPEVAVIGDADPATDPAVQKELENAGITDPEPETKAEDVDSLLGSDS